MLAVPGQQIVNGIHRSDRNVQGIDVCLGWEWDVGKQCFGKCSVIIVDFKNGNVIEVREPFSGSGFITG